MPLPPGKDAFHDFSQTSFGGVPCAQFFCDFLLWEAVLNDNPQLQGIVEIGTWQGGFSRFLYAQAEARGMSFFTCDAQLPDVPAPNFERLDVFSPDGLNAMEEILAHGPVALFCDGGNKPRELRTFPLMCRDPDSVVLVHDWGTETLPTDVPDFLEEIYGDFCDRIGSMTRVFKMRSPEAA